MGIDYRPIIAIGLEFENAREAFDFLDSHGLMDDEAVQYYEENYLDECLPCNMDGCTLDAYSGYGYYIGYDIGCSSPDVFKRDFEEGMKNWNEAFGGKVEPEIIHTIEVY